MPKFQSSETVILAPAPSAYNKPNNPSRDRLNNLNMTEEERLHKPRTQFFMFDMSVDSYGGPTTMWASEFTLPPVLDHIPLSEELSAAEVFGAPPRHRAFSVH